jgi:Leucine Rich repeat
MIENLESLKKHAKRWLDDLRAKSPDARARLERAIPNAPASPTLRDVHHALAREHGFPGWVDLKRAVARGRQERAHALAEYETKAEALLDAYRTGTPTAMERHYRHTWHRRAWKAMRTYVQLDLGKRPTEPDGDVPITLDDARHLVATEHGFKDWDALQASTKSRPAGARLAAKPVRLVELAATEDSESIAITRDWNEALQLMAAHPSACLAAQGQMTDDVLADVARIENIGALRLGGSQSLTDEGIRHLAKLSTLKHLDLSGTAITNRGLEVLRALPNLHTLSLAWTHVTDDGLAPLSGCAELERVDLSWTRTGDGALKALAGKRRLRHLATGFNVTDAGIQLLHELPIFKSWHGGEPKLALLSYSPEPNSLLLRGPFSDSGMQHMRGLDGLFGLNLAESRLTITARSLEPLTSLPHLGFLAVEAKDDWMPYFPDMPRLRFLGIQDTTASDEGFMALSRSQSVEYIWGRRCHNMRRRGFAALANMPALQGLSVSCLNVDDGGVAALPTFPALRELMPIDIPDAGYRHVGKCEHLESLVLMYCRDSTDAATELITGLRRLSYYFNSYTAITDRTPELLSGMDSLERVNFDTCHELTDAGIAKLARLPRLRELQVSGRKLTNEVTTAFPPRVRVRFEGAA